MDFRTLEKKAGKCFKWGLMRHPNRSREDGAESIVDYEGKSQEASEEKSIVNGPEIIIEIV